MWSNKAEGACHSNEPPGPHPWPSLDTRKHTHATHLHTHKKKQKQKPTNDQMPYSQHPVNKQTPTYSSDTTDAELIVLTPDVVSAHFSSLV